MSKFLQNSDLAEEQRNIKSDELKLYEKLQRALKMRKIAPKRCEKDIEIQNDSVVFICLERWTHSAHRWSSVDTKKCFSITF